MKFIKTVLVSLSLVAGPALAQSSPCSALFTTNDIYQCLVGEHAIADKELNEAYDAVQSTLRLSNNGRSQALTSAQRAWITLRDLDCVSESMPFQGGTFQKVLIQSCLTRMTKERTLYLETHYALEAP